MNDYRPTLYDLFGRRNEATLEEMTKIARYSEEIAGDPEYGAEMTIFIWKLGLSINQVRRALDFSRPVKDE